MQSASPCQRIKKILQSGRTPILPVLSKNEPIGILCFLSYNMLILAKHEANRRAGRMKFEYLKHLLVIADCKSISRAAEKLRMSQPALTKEINFVEDELGIQLFIRSNKGVIPTKQSESFFRESEIVLSYYHSWKSNKKNMDLEAVNIAVSELFCQLIFSDLLVEMHKNRPQADIRITEHSTQEIISSLPLQNYDLAVVMCLPEDETRIAEKVRSLNYEMELLHSDSYCVFMNSRHVLADRKEIFLADLETSVLALYSNSSAFLYSGFLGSRFAQKIFLPNSDMITTILDNETNFVSFWSKLIVKDAIRLSTHLWTCKEIKDFPMPFNHYVIYPQKKYVSPAAKVVLAKIKEWYQKQRHD